MPKAKFPRFPPSARLKALQLNIAVNKPDIMSHYIGQKDDQEYDKENFMNHIKLENSLVKQGTFQNYSSKKSEDLSPNNEIIRESQMSYIADESINMSSHRSILKPNLTKWHCTPGMHLK